MSLALFGCFCDHCGCVSFVLKLYDCVILHSTDILFLFDNRLMGTVPSEIGTMSTLSESSVVWLLVMLIVVVFFIVL